MRKKGTKNHKYSAEFKISVIMDMRANHIGYRETARKNRENEKLVKSLISCLLIC